MCLNQANLAKNWVVEPLSRMEAKALVGSVEKMTVVGFPSRVGSMKVWPVRKVTVRRSASPVE